MGKSLSLDERIAVCKQVPPADWDHFFGLQHVAVNITTFRIVDGDNDLQTLQDRLDAKIRPDEQCIIVPGNKRKAQDQQSSRNMP